MEQEIRTRWQCDSVGACPEICAQPLKRKDNAAAIQNPAKRQRRRPTFYRWEKELTEELQRRGKLGWRCVERLIASRVKIPAIEKAMAQPGPLPTLTLLHKISTSATQGSFAKSGSVSGERFGSYSENLLGPYIHPMKMKIASRICSYCCRTVSSTTPSCVF